MTTHDRDRATRGGEAPAPDPSEAADPPAPSRPGWLVPGLLVALIAGGLVLAGLVPLSTVLYAGLFGGMILMHVGGHGHGGHGAGGSGHGGHGHATPAAWTDGAADLSRRSSRSQRAGPGSAAEFDEGAPNDSTTGENDHDQHSSHGCH